MKLNSNNLVEVTREEVLNALAGVPRDSDSIDQEIQTRIEMPAYELAGKEFGNDDVYSVFADVDVLRDAQHEYLSTPDLFNILSGIYSSDYCAETLADPDAVISYAESMGVDIDYDQAAKIISVGLKWINEIENGNGEWSRMRGEARQALES